MLGRFPLWMVLFFFVIKSSAKDTLLVGIKDLGSPIRSMVQNERGEIFIQVLDQVYKIEKDDFILTNFEISSNDELHFQGGKLTTMQELNDKKIKIIHGPNNTSVWNKFLAKAGTENLGAYFKDKKNNYWVFNGSKFLYKFVITDFFERNLKQVSTRGILSVGKDFYVNSYSGFFKNGLKVEPDFLLGGSNIFHKEGKLYFATVRDLYTYDLNTSKVNLIFKNNLENKVDEIACVFFFDGNLWIGSIKGLFKLVENNKVETTSIIEHVNNFRIINGKLFILCNGSVYFNEKGQFKKFENLPSDVEYNDVMEVNNFYYFASSEGLLKLDPNTLHFEKCFQNTIYENKEFFSIEKDENNYLWIGSNLGLLRYNIETRIFELFMKDIEFNKRSSYKLGEYHYFGSTDGYIKFSPKNFFSSDLSLSNEYQIKEESHIYKYLLLFATFLIISLVIYYNQKLKKLSTANKTSEKEDFSDLKMHSDGIGKYEMNKIEAYIIENIDTINVDKLRDDSGLTKNVFYKVFSQYYDVTPKKLIDILKEERIQIRKKVHKK